MNKDGRFHAGQVAVIAVGHMVHDIYSSFLAPVMPLLLETVGGSLSTAGILSLAPKLPTLANPIIGRAIDRSGLRHVFVLSPLVTAVCMSCLGLASSFATIFGVLLLAGISAVLFHAPAPVLVREVAGDSPGRGMSYFMLGGEMSRTLGPLVILSAISFWGFDRCYWLIPLGAATSILLFLNFRNESREHREKSKNDSHERLRDILRTNRRLLIAVFGILFFRAGIKIAFSAFLPLLMIEQGASLWQAGIMLSLLQLTGAFGTYLGGTVSDRIGRKTTMGLALSISIVGAGLFLFFPGDYTVALLAFTGIGLFAINPVMMAVVNESKTSSPVFINSLYMTISGLFSCTATLLVGFGGDMITLWWSFLIVVVMSLGAAPCIALLPRS